MLLQIHPDADTPIYVQLRNQIVMGIGRGELKTGERLPTVRQMAQDTGINTMTVNKAYGILRKEGFIDIDRRHGATVAAQTENCKDFREKLENELLLLVAESNIRGVRRNEFLELCGRMYDQMFERVVCPPGAGQI